MVRFKNPYVWGGITTLEYNVIRLVMGMGKPGSYAEIGLQNAAMMKNNLTEKEFRPEFLKILRKGLICILDEAQLKLEFRARRYKITDKGWEAICDIEIAKGGDHYFYREFDGDPSQLNRFSRRVGRLEVGAGGPASQEQVLKTALARMSPAARARWKGKNPRFANIG